MKNRISGRSMPIRIHPDNPRCFLFRDRPIALLCATEHYGAVLNRRFDYARYLRDHAAHGHTLTRLFGLFRELQGANNPYSTCKPESPDFVTPWPRTGPGRACDGEPRYDLGVWNDEYFERLHGFVTLASELGVLIEVTLFSNSYHDGIWALNPLHSANNLQGIGELPSSNFYLTGSSQPLWAKQEEYARKMVMELNRYDNIYFEICNEPGTFDPETVPPAVIDAWQKRVAGVIRETEAGLPNRHLIFGAQAFTIPPFHQHNDDAAAWPELDALNVHPLPDTSFGGRTYNMGGFMSGQLHLEEFRAFSLAVAEVPRPCVHDEDNIASCYRDVRGWTIHRMRAWTALMCGAGYDVIDFSITIHTPDGTADSRQHIRAWLGHLSKFVHSLDLVRARPVGAWLIDKPAGLLECTLALEGEEYAIYLADACEPDAPGWGTPRSGEIACALPAGNYLIRIFSPATGLYSPGIQVPGGATAKLTLPEFHHDIALRLTRC